MTLVPVRVEVGPNGVLVVEWGIRAQAVPAGR